MSQYNGIHHVMKEAKTDNIGLSFCGRMISSHDMPIDAETAARLKEESGRARPCKKCMDKVNED